MALRLHQATGQVRAQKLRLYEASAKAAITGQRLRIHTVSSKWVTPTPPPTITVTAGTGRYFDPNVLVTLTGVSPDSPDSWVWDQTAGPDVGLTGKDSRIATFTTPYLVDLTSVTFKVTIFKGTSTPASATVTHQIYPHAIWSRDADGSFNPVLIFAASS